MARENKKEDRHSGNVFCALVIEALAGSAYAFYIDADRALEFTEKAQTRVSLRLQVHPVCGVGPE